MTSSSREEASRLLMELSDDKREALDQLVPVVYAELRRNLSR
jgi:hypothetical protein